MNDDPTAFTLYDTIEVLAKRNPNWVKDNFCQMIFAWQASLFLKSHLQEVCNEKCPELLDLCIEYSEHKTINGQFLPTLFGTEAIEYITRNTIELPEYKNFGTSPVSNSFFTTLPYRPPNKE